LTHGSLFDGAGGMRIGFEQAGIKTAWAIDILNGQDIHGYGKINLEKPDIISGGPPCQGTSLVGKLNCKNLHTSLWPEMLRIIQEVKPAWVVIEQPVVDKRIVRSWAKELQLDGYGIAGRVIDSRHWVPQQRSRWFIIGRLGITGLALWDYLYPECDRVEKGSAAPAVYRLPAFLGSCSDCLRSGFFAGPTSRSLALMGAGNAVTVPVARWIAENIIRGRRRYCYSG